MEGLDLKDWKILEQLCTNARTSHNSIAKAIGVSKNAVSYKVDRLLKRRVIGGFFAIINLESLGYSIYNLFLRLRAGKEKEQELAVFLKSHPNTQVVDRLVGEWNFLVEFACRQASEMNDFVSDVKSRFSDIIDVFEVHPMLEDYKVEQLPVELVTERPVALFKKQEKVEVDELDLRLLSELNKNCTASLLVLAKTLGITYETVSARIKRLKEKGIIILFTAKINLGALGYDVYLLRLNLRNLSTERAASLRGYINAQRNIRYAFISAHAPVLFIYLAVKKSEELNNFLMGIKEKFSDVIVNQKYWLSPEQLKYEIFPEGLLQK